VKRIVCDTGPIVHLSEANLLSLLEAAGEAEAALDRLRGSSLWVSPRVLSEARSALLDLFP
jgi:hypothetical protein